MKEIILTDDLRASTVWLKISSWTGISMGAIHVYGSLRSEERDSEIELKRKLTVSQARKLSKQQSENSLFGTEYHWKEGQETRCFDTEEELKAFAKKHWKTHFSGKKRLVVGDPAYCDDKVEVLEEL